MFRFARYFILVNYTGSLIITLTCANYTCFAVSREQPSRARECCSWWRILRIFNHPRIASVPHKLRVLPSKAAFLIMRALYTTNIPDLRFLAPVVSLHILAWLLSPAVAWIHQRDRHAANGRASCFDTLTSANSTSDLRVYIIPIYIMLTLCAA